MLTIEYGARLGEAVHGQLVRALAGLSTLDDLVRWASRDSPPRDILNIVVQDEFSHDVVLGWRTVFLAFETT